ncbi:hypothetical protein [Burkholderia ubonensis]|uniref:hypothetical protein n=1 Tax=Burkholderia ubonensis TaxID=101571 RepID=UPI0012FCA00B|nr:hypothetical protein [Burkholderia ubonensis]
MLDGRVAVDVGIQSAPLSCELLHDLYMHRPWRNMGIKVTPKGSLLEFNHDKVIASLVRGDPGFSTQVQIDRHFISRFGLWRDCQVKLVAGARKMSRAHARKTDSHPPNHIPRIIVGRDDFNFCWLF